MQKHGEFDGSAPSELSGLEDRAPGDLPSMVKWKVAGPGLWSARAKLDIGGLVYLSVERLPEGMWDWLVWDSGCQVLPRHGTAHTDAAAKDRAERSLLAINGILNVTRDPMDVADGARAGRPRALN